MEVADLFSVNPWPHQLEGVEKTIKAIKPGKFICLCSPTGGGKSKMMEALTRYALRKGQRVDLKVHRKMLLEQLSETFKRAGVKFGVRSASKPDEADFDQPVQISSMPTEIRRCVGEDAKWALHDADLVIVDEAHLQLGAKYLQILKAQAAMGACVICITATPIDMAPCTEIIVAGKNSELRNCKSHVPAIIRAPFEFDLSKIKREKTGEFQIGDSTKSIFSQAIVGSIINEARKTNPGLQPTLVFAPDVKSSIWLAGEFCDHGITAAHIDGTDVWYDGELKSDPDGRHRREVMELFEAGEIKVLCNRYVMREGIDCPFIKHLILATPFGSLKTFTQVVGRALRWSPTTPDFVWIQDHGGNCLRFGSPNADRDWEELFHMSEDERAEKQRDDEQERDEDPPITCPFCGTMRLSGPKCPEPPIGCGKEAGFKGKRIIQKTGKLREISEQELAKRHQVKPKSPQQLWDEMYWACKNGKRAMSFKQAFVLFKKRHGFYPPHNLRNTPRLKSDHGVAIRDLPKEDLIR